MGRRGRVQPTAQDEAERLAAMAVEADRPDDPDDDDDGEEFDPDLVDMNDPDVETLGQPPLIGRQGTPSNMYGNMADTMGRATSPRLYASAAQFPNAAQLRVWRWENGVPVGIGAIDAQANEEEFIRMFFDAMPKKGDGRLQFKLRPIDIRGQELGKEVTINISEFHQSLQMLRRQREEAMNPPGFGQGGVVINPTGDPAAATYAEEMGRMFEHATEMAETQTRNLQAQLERERDEVREQDRKRAEERVNVAERATNTVEKMTERLMATDKQRSDEVLTMQKDQSHLMLNTLTTVFAANQSAQQQAAERQRMMDVEKAKSDREFFDRQRKEVEERRQFELQEAEAKRRLEREEAEQRRLSDKAEWERKQQEIKMEAERRSEAERRELAFRQEQMKEERERWRVEIEEKRRGEQLEWEKKQAAEKEDRDRRERSERDDRERREKLERERFEREKMDMQQRSDVEKREWERRESLRREEYDRAEVRRREDAAAAEARRREEIQLQLKQLETSATRDREHAERMMDMARQEREAQREAALQREKMEREAREQSERDRNRQHDLQIKEMEMARERDREHGERMLQISKDKDSGGLNALNSVLGMDTSEVLGRIFGGKEAGEEGGWVEAIPKVLGAIADLGKVAITNQQKKGDEDKPRRTKDRQVALQGPDGTIRMVPMSTVVQTPPTPPQPAAPTPIHMPVDQVMDELDDLPVDPYVPRQVRRSGSRVAQPQPTESPVPSVTASPAEAKLKAGSSVNVLKRARVSGISVLEQRRSRKAVKELANRLAHAEESQWLGIVTEELTKNVGIFAYLKAVTVYAALAEAGADAKLAERIVNAIQNSGMVPDGALPYDEDDYAREQVAEAARVVSDIESGVAVDDADSNGPAEAGGAA